MPLTDSESQFIVTPHGDEILYEVNRDSFDRIGSDALFRQHFGELFRAEDTLFVIVGTDSGLLTRWILHKPLPAGSRFVFVELSGIVDAVASRLPDQADSQRLAVITPDQWATLEQPFRYQEYAYINRVRLVASLGALDAYLPDYRMLHQTVEQAVDRLQHAVRDQLGSQVFIRRQIENLADNLQPAEHLRGRLAGHTAVILGGGPSLDQVLPWVREHRDRLVVFAVSRIARQLLAHRLTPDIMVSIDPHAVSFDVSKEMLRLDPDTLLINAFHVSPLLLGQWQGTALYGGNRYPWQTRREEQNLAAAGPTVTNTALAMAVQLGCAQVVLAGVDLCYSREGHTHASGSNERLAGPQLGAVGNRVETNGGWLADTDAPFALAVELMGQQAAHAREQGCRIINPAPGAARIPHVDHCPLAAIELPGGLPPARDTIARHLPVLDSDARCRVLQDSAAELARVNGRLRSMLKLTEQALDCNDALFGRNGRDADFRYKKRMDKIERRLDQEFQDLSPVVKSFGAAGFLRLIRPDREREWSDDELEALGRNYYRIYGESIRQLLDHVEAAQARVAARLEEEADSPDLARLFAQWRRDDTPGRARLLQARRPELADRLSAEQQAQLGELQQAFERVLDDQDTAQARRCRAQHVLAPVRSKLLVLRQRQDSGELARLAEQLGKQDSAEAGELQALALGYLAEIQDQPTQALAHYSRILHAAADQLGEGLREQPHNPRLEDALRRMSVITLQQGDTANALMVLDVLAAMSPVYEPQYADLLRLSGRLQDAVNAYTDYLQKVPGDLSTMLKLGRLFQDAGVVDSARWAYGYVLEKDPDNKAARGLLQDLGEAASSS